MGITFLIGFEIEVSKGKIEKLRVTDANEVSDIDLGTSVPEQEGERVFGEIKKAIQKSVSTYLGVIQGVYDTGETPNHEE